VPAAAWLAGRAGRQLRVPADLRDREHSAEPPIHLRGGWAAPDDPPSAPGPDRLRDHTGPDQRRIGLGACHQERATGWSRARGARRGHRARHVGTVPPAPPLGLPPGLSVAVDERDSPGINTAMPHAPTIPVGPPRVTRSALSLLGRLVLLCIGVRI